MFERRRVAEPRRGPQHFRSRPPIGARSGASAARPRPGRRSGRWPRSRPASRPGHGSQRGEQPGEPAGLLRRDDDHGPAGAVAGAPRSDGTAAAEPYRTSPSTSTVGGAAGLTLVRLPRSTTRQPAASIWALSASARAQSRRARASVRSRTRWVISAGGPAGVGWVSHSGRIAGPGARPARAAPAPTGSLGSSARLVGAGLRRFAGRHRRHDRQQDRDAGAVRGDVLGPGLAAVGPGQLAHDRQPQPRAAAAARRIGPEEALEDLLRGPGREARPVVGDAQRDAGRPAGQRQSAPRGARRGRRRAAPTARSRPGSAGSARPPAGRR